jgi:preprotein translocase subunit SecY
MPYISASIFMQLMTILVPQLQKVQKEGESGRKKINQWTRYLTVIVTAFQAGAYVAYLNGPVTLKQLSRPINLTSGCQPLLYLPQELVCYVARRKDTGQGIR